MLMGTSYQCACAEGFDGLSCEHSAYFPSDQTGSGVVSASAVCECGNPAGYRAVELSDFSLPVDGVTDEWLLRANGADAPLRIRSTHAPFGAAFYRIATVDGKEFLTTCPHLQSGPHGEQLTFYDANWTGALLWTRTTFLGAAAFLAGA